jgi:NAD(P)-dependent dehydrogenase (short-subunit alcohol dehydrogenase family)
MEVLITGGEQGLGNAILKKLIPESFVNIEGDKIIDAWGYDALKELAYKVVEEEGKPDIIINNYGLNHLSWIGTTPKDDAAILDINVLFPYWIVNAVMEIYDQPCRVLNISSQTYRVPQRCTSLYCASKAALSHMTKVMARELAPKGWVINAYAPGKILGTSMTRKVDEQVKELRGWSEIESDGYAKHLIPMGRFMTLDEAAHIAVHILNSPSYINGTTIEAFGGV